MACMVKNLGIGRGRDIMDPGSGAIAQQEVSLSRGQQEPVANGHLSAPKLVSATGVSRLELSTTGARL